VESALNHLAKFESRRTIFVSSEAPTSATADEIAQLICPTRLGKNQNRSPSESKMFYLRAVDRGCVESPTRFEALWAKAFYRFRVALDSCPASVAKPILPVAIERER
jgi:hypothetical protein